MFYSVTLPFLTLAYQLKGVDIGTMFHAFIFSFFVVQTLHALVLALFADGRNWLELVARFIACLLLAAALLLFLGFVARDFVLADPFHVSIETFIIILLYSFLFVILPAVLLLIAGCQFASPMSNRMLVPRIVVSSLGFPLFVLCFAMSLPGTVFGVRWGVVSMHWDGWSLGIFMLLWLYPLSFFSIIAACERNSYGLRLRRSIPGKLWKRLLVFPLFTGDCNAFCWLFLWNALLLAALFGSGTFDGIARMGGLTFFSTSLLCFNYAILAVYIQKRLLRRWVPKELTWLVMLGLMLLGTICSVVLFADMLTLQWWSTLIHITDAFILVPNPIWILAPSGRGNQYDMQNIQFWFSLAWFALSSICLGIWARHKFTTGFLPATQEQGM
jgi:hypothetical protein